AQAHLHRWHTRQCLLDQRTEVDDTVGHGWSWAARGGDATGHHYAHAHRGTSGRGARRALNTPQHTSIHPACPTARAAHPSPTSRGAWAFPALAPTATPPIE